MEDTLTVTKKLFLAIFCISLLGCFNPKPKINLIESDLEIKFPQEYILIKNYEDWFGFDLTQEFSFQFDNKNFQYILSQIENNEKWIPEGSIYSFTKTQMREDNPDVISWSVEAKLDTSNKTLNYIYWEY